MRKLNLTWNVLLYDFNIMEPITYNIFNNHRVHEDTPKLLKQCKDKKEFKDEFRDLLRWQFWGRCQYEMILSSWPPSEKDKTYKLDVYEQCMLNFDRLCDYIYAEYENKHLLIGEKKNG